MNARFIFTLAALGACILFAGAQQGPFNPEQWPPTVDSTKTVHYVTTDGDFQPPGANWLSDQLTILAGGDQDTADATIGGHLGKKVIGAYLNTADQGFTEWADNDTIDALVQVYGNEGVLSGQGTPRDFNFLLGTLPPTYLSFPSGGQIPVEAKNQQWNWVLFRITNSIRPDGERFLGSVSEAGQASPGGQVGGVNNGTIRFENVTGLIVRVIAFGEQGAFGEPDAINKFAAGVVCQPEPQTNLADLDLAAGTTNHLVILNNGDQTVTIQDDVGPTGAKRRAARPTATYMNFGITDNYLGLPCNDPRVIKVCVDYYDDPAAAGVKFGPESYATDNQGGRGIFPTDQWQTLEGSGEWRQRAWSVPAVSLAGVNTEPLTGGPRFGFEGGSVSVSRVALAVMRVGNHPLAGQDPLSSCVEDPSICTDAYGSTAELDLAKDIREGLDVGTSGGDQEMIVAEAGPAGDRRMAVRPARDDGSAQFEHSYLNFQITNEALGPNSQPPAHLAICVSYYDDPALIGKQFKPEVYTSVRGGVQALAFTPDSFFVVLDGTDKWRDAYWEIPDMKFVGVNQGPQAAARFYADDKIFISRVRYAVIRPCGPNAGKNALEACKPPVMTAERGPDNTILIGWPVSAQGVVLESTAALDTGANTVWQAVTATPTVVGDQNVVSLPAQSTTYFRLR